MFTSPVTKSAAGEPSPEFVDREVFTPAGMERTVPDLGDNGPDEAVKYDRATLGTLRRGQEIDMSWMERPRPLHPWLGAGKRGFTGVQIRAQVAQP